MRKFGVFIARLQPLHVGHEKIIQDALKEVETLIVVLGSANLPRTIKNPFTSHERQTMLRISMKLVDYERIIFVEARDTWYHDALWVIQVAEKVRNWTGEEKDIVLFGKDKDRSTYYLKMFPQWDFLPADTACLDIDATRIRDAFFRGDMEFVRVHTSTRVFQFLDDFRISKYSAYGDEDHIYEKLQNEYRMIRGYKLSWQTAPFPPTFVTVDAVVLGLGHVLVVRRAAFPGKGLIALPGGFLNQHETLLDGAIRELKEETGIRLGAGQLKATLGEQRVFDHPDRSLRGRTITHAFCFNLDKSQEREILPAVKGADDADKAWWMPLQEAFARESEFYEDHLAIIQHFVYR